MTWDKLLALQPVRDLVADRWNDSGGEEWTDDAISENLLLISPNARDVTWPYFSIVRAFFNQQLMFDVIGYDSQFAFDTVRGELISGSYEFLDDVAALDWALILSRFPIVKVRSVSGDYSFIVSSADDASMLCGQSEFGSN